MNTYIIAAILAVFLVLLMICIMGFKNWLLWAVSEAEKTLGSKTGELKLMYAYDLAVARFPILSKLIPFNIFASMVDGALDIMREMIEENEAINKAITSGKGEV